jgi:hypothetical protein
MARRRLGFLVMLLVSLVTAHNLVFLLAYGPRAGEELAHTGHGDAWQAAVAVVLVVAVSLLSIALWRIRQLGLLARNLAPAPDRRSSGPSPLGRRLVILWSRLVVATALALLVQENLEHLQAGLPLPGLTVLGSSEYPDALLIIIGVTLAVAVVGSLVRWRRAVLIARLAAAVRRFRPRAATRQRRPTEPDARPGAVIGCAITVRAPPLLPAV